MTITSRRKVDTTGPEFYPTPDWATYALIDNEHFEGAIWEPACGDGAMAKVLIKAGYQVDGTDLHDRGYGTSRVDFTLERANSVANIVTNPPYNLAEEFIHTGLLLAQHKLALLLRLAFLESGGRHNRLFSRTPPARVWVFSERLTFYPGDTGKRDGTLAYAWFVWEKNRYGFRPNATELRWLPPKYKNAINGLAKAS